MDPIVICTIVFGALGAAAALVRLFRELYKAFKKLKDYRIMRYFRHLEDLMSAYGRTHDLTTKQFQDFKFYLGRAQRADYKRKLKDAGQEDMLRRAEDLEDKLNGVKLLEDGYQTDEDEKHHDEEEHHHAEEHEHEFV